MPEPNPVWWFRWACIDAGNRIHTDMPTVAECEAAGWEHVGNDPRYGNSLLMMRKVDHE
jgi:hypothetical protein